MKYDFTSIMDRIGHDAMAVDLPAQKKGSFSSIELKEGFDLIPMWVADMSFPVAPSVTAALQERIKHPSYGYFMHSDAYYDSIINWFAKRKNVTDLKREYIGYENGVLGGVVSAMRILASQGDSVLVHSPTYIGFTMVLSNNGYNIVHSPLVQDENGVWRMDYEDMEKKIVDNHITVAIMCNPHNPCGRVWTEEELRKAMEVYEKHNVYVISDEIWADIVLNGNVQIPTQQVSEYAKQHTIAFYAPSKTFSLAGLIGSYHIIYNSWLKQRMDKESSLSHYNSMNVLSMHALVGAYTEEGMEWVDELNEVLSGNVNYACDFIEKNFRGVSVKKPEGTYMLFLDCTDYCKETGRELDDLIKAGWDVGVLWQDGRPFHGEYSIRMNLALPFSRVQEAFDRLQKYAF